MTDAGGHLLYLGRLTLREPKKGLREVLRLDLPMQTRIEALVLLSVLSTLLLVAGMWIAPPPAGSPLIELLGGSPVISAAIQAGGLLVMAVLVHAVGRVWGGQGSFADAVLSLVWLQALFLALQAVQVLLLLVLPPAASLISLVSMVLFFWLLTHFVTELHGFSSAGRVFLGIVAVFLGMSMLLGALLTAFVGSEALLDV